MQQITFCLPTAQLHSLEKPISTGKSNFWPISTGKTNFWLRSTTFKLQPRNFNCSSRKGWEWGDNYVFLAHFKRIRHEKIMGTKKGGINDGHDKSLHSPYLWLETFISLANSLEWHLWHVKNAKTHWARQKSEKVCWFPNWERSRCGVWHLVEFCGVL